MTQIDQIYPGVAMVVFNQKGEVLLQKRADIAKWGLLSGHVEPGETVENAAIREVREEAALTVKVKKLIGVYSDPNFQLFHYPTGKCVHFITNCFLMEITGGSLLNNSNESLALKFFNPEHLPENLLKMGAFVVTRCTIWSRSSIYSVIIWKERIFNAVFLGLAEI